MRRIGWPLWELRTWGQALLELLGLVGVLQHQGVLVAVASDLELDLVGLSVLLYPRSYTDESISNSVFIIQVCAFSCCLSRSYEALKMTMEIHAGFRRSAEERDRGI